MPQHWKYKIGQRVRINKNAKLFYPQAIGKEGYIDELLMQSLVDYGIKTDCGGFYTLKESEIDIIEEEQLNMNKIELHRKILDEIHDTYKRKNQDYGDSFSQQFEEYGFISLLIRLNDKMLRLKQLHKNEAQVKDESIIDTLLDLSNYAIMGIMELEQSSDKNK